MLPVRRCNRILQCHALLSEHRNRKIKDYKEVKMNALYQMQAIKELRSSISTLYVFVTCVEKALSVPLVRLKSWNASATVVRP